MIVSLVATNSYLPEKIVPNDFFITEGASDDHPMFKGTNLRHHVAENETAVDMMERASAQLVKDLNLDVKKDIDILLSNVTCLDQPFTGSGAGIAYRLGADPAWIIDHQNGGCVSFLYMMDVARALMAGSNAKTALICNVQNAAGRIFSHPENRKLAQSAVPGDGCGVGYLIANDSSPIITIVKKTYGEFAGDMRMISDDGKEWWEPRTTPCHVEFTERKIAKVIGRGNRMVTEVMQKALDAASLKSSDIDFLITNQPNRVFLRNWREALQMKPEQHIQTFADHGNLFGAAIPICLTKGVNDGLIQKGHRLMLAGFSHAGDYAAASIVHWHANR